METRRPCSPVLEVLEHLFIGESGVRVLVFFFPIEHQDFEASQLVFDVHRVFLARQGGIS